MIRIGIVGTAGIGAKHFAALKKIPEAKVTALIDINAEPAQKLVYGSKDITVCSTIEESLAFVDALYICTPPDSHRDLAIRAFGAGKHVFCEKPIATTIEDASAILECAQHTGLMLGVGFNMRSRDSYQRMKGILDSGVLGEPASYWCMRLGMLDVPFNNWRVDTNHIVGMTIESLSHDFDTIRWLFGEVESVNAHIIESKLHPRGFDDNAHINLALKNGVKANIIASWSSYLGKSSRGIIGTKGTVELMGDDTWNSNCLRLKLKGAEETNIQELQESLDPSAYIGINKDFLTTIQTGIEHVPNGIDGLEALRISLAARESAIHGGRLIAL